MLLVKSALNVIRNYDAYVRVTSTFGMLTEIIWVNVADWKVDHQVFGHDLDTRGKIFRVGDSL